MMLSRAKPAVADTPPPLDSRRKKGKKVPQLEELLALRDFTGAIALLEFKRQVGEQEEDTDLWMGYCAFHLGDYKRALEEYEALTKQPACNPDVWVNLACTYFFLGMYIQAEQAALKAPKSRLQNRLLFHLAHKFGDEKKLMSSHQNLHDITEDQLSLASIHYMRSHYQEAIDIYKRILLDNREYLALNVYVALCYYKLDYYDVSQEVLAVYLQQVPDSTIALNLKACNHFRLHNGKAAEAELKNLTESASSSFEFGKELIKHNLVVFRGGEGALQVLPPLVDVIPEARLNLVIYYLRQDDVQEAYNLMKDLEPTAPQEYILKGVVNAAVGQEMGLRDHLKIAQQFFQLVGESASECDTIPGRQCMSSHFFLLRQFGNVLIYLNSVKSYFYNDDTFNFNYAQAKAATGCFNEAEEVFLLIQSEKIKRDFVYLSWLARCYIVNKKPQLAWKLYREMETSGDSFSLLQLIANDCYKLRQFYYSAKAFDVLERLDSNTEYWEGKRGACVGVFQMILAGQEAKETLREVLHLLKSTGNSQVEYIVRVMKKWAKENRVPV
ncbi:intraflagellar transport protein 56 isoform X1 [Pezoporus wallicus]|uniref:intraflagellar transport protein 56 isoform X1 n=1 Tax=Pezoporus wallicus TaxID=35540 RepID=UPI00254E5088|nr:intraflagellar transport protein 56 isoform X1 [Pezoporus wallicus]XP_061306626.1 intraflagellar transport protein 56 isoform X1 [Pezoporus flaviventris]